MMVQSIQVRMADIQATKLQIVEQMLRIKNLNAEQIAEIQKIEVTQAGTVAIWQQVGAMALQKLALFGMIYYTQKLGSDSANAATGVGMLAGAFMGLAIAIQTAVHAKYGIGGVVASIAAGAVAMGIFNRYMYKMMNQPVDFDTSVYDWQPDMGSVEAIPREIGGPVYPRMQQGGSVRERPYIVGERGPELFVPNTAGNIVPNNELGGVTIQIMGDVYDSDKFAEKVAEVLPSTARIMVNRGMM